MIKNLGAVLQVLAKAEARELDLHADVDAYQAPSECHGLVSQYEGKRRRLARRQAEAMASRPLRVILREAKKRGCPVNGRVLNRLVSTQIRHPILTGEW